MPGHFALILHAHLPFVRHPEHEHFFEEEWSEFLQLVRNLV